MEIIIITNDKDSPYEKEQNDNLIKYLRKADYSSKLKPKKVKREGSDFITYLIYKK